MADGPLRRAPAGAIRSRVQNRYNAPPRRGHLASPPRGEYDARPLPSRSYAFYLDSRPSERAHNIACVHAIGPAACIFARLRHQKCSHVPVTISRIRGRHLAHARTPRRYVQIKERGPIRGGEALSTESREPASPYLPGSFAMYRSATCRSSRSE